MIRYKIITRDWKGTYSDTPTGWVLHAGEDEINTGGDSFATIYSKGKSTKKLTGQEVYDIHQSLLAGEDEKDYDIDEKDDNILIEKAAAVK